VISKDQYKLLQQSDEARQLVISVDDFSTEELMHIASSPSSKTASKTSAKPTRKKTQKVQ